MHCKIQWILASTIKLSSAIVLPLTLHTLPNTLDKLWYQLASSSVPEHVMPWHDMGVIMPFLPWVNLSMHHRVNHVPLTPLSLLDTLLDQAVHQTRQ
jgi:hypothetical protein